MKNDNSVIGRFKGVVKKKTLTFIPSWNQNGQEVKAFTDIRGLQRELK